MTGPVRDLLRGTVTVDRAGLQGRDGLRTALGVGVPLLVGLAVDRPLDGLAAAGGAFAAGFALAELADALRAGRSPDPLPELLLAQQDLAAALDVRVRADPTTALDAAVLDVETHALAAAAAAAAQALAGRAPSRPEGLRD